jgi:hypothetical protein
MRAGERKGGTGHGSSRYRARGAGQHQHNEGWSQANGKQRNDRCREADQDEPAITRTITERPEEETEQRA